MIFLGPKAHDVEVHVPSQLGNGRMRRIRTGDAVGGLLHLAAIRLGRRIGVSFSRKNGLKLTWNHKQ